MPTFVSGIMHRAQALADELNIAFNEDDVKLRINVQSPGVSEKYGKIVSVALVSVVVIGLFGGTVNFKYKDKTGVDAQLEVGTQGLPHLIETVHKVNNEYDGKHPYNEKNLTTIVDRAKIKDPRKEYSQVPPISDPEPNDEEVEETQE